MAFLVETQTQLRAAAAFAPVMHRLFDPGYSPPQRRLGPHREPVTEVYDQVERPLRLMMYAAADISDDVPTEPTHDALVEYVRASANTAAATSDGKRRLAREWARYRDSLATAAMGEWNVMARRWAAAADITIAAASRNRDRFPGNYAVSAFWDRLEPIRALRTEFQTPAWAGWNPPTTTQDTGPKVEQILLRL